MVADQSKTNEENVFSELSAANDAFIGLATELPTSHHAENLRQKTMEASERLLSEYKKEVKMLEKEAADFLRNLDDRLHDQDTVRGVINAFPSALRQYHDCKIIGTRPEHYMPVRWLLRGSEELTTHGYSFVPLLVSEGVARNIFSHEERGGLIEPKYDFHYIRYILVTNGTKMLRDQLGINGDEFYRRLSDKSDTDIYTLVNKMNDEKVTNVLRKLFELNFLQRQDIIDYDMIECSCCGIHTMRRLEFVLSICPEGVASIFGYEEWFPLQYSISVKERHGFDAILKVGLSYYPRNVGFLFEKSPSLSGRTVIELAMADEYLGLSPSYIFRLIHEAIPPSNGHPILHDVIRLAPKYTSLFWKHYPDSVYLRDKKGRLPLHVALQRAAKWSKPLWSLISINQRFDEDKKDPVTGLYPFMSAASDRGGNDLSVVYHILRSDPNVWEGFTAYP